MRKERTNPQKKQRFYDVENLSVTAVYNDDFYRDIHTTKNYRQYLRGYIDYSYNFKPVNIRPFNKLISDTAKSAKYRCDIVGNFWCWNRFSNDPNENFLFRVAV